MEKNSEIENISKVEKLKSKIIKNNENNKDLIEKIFHEIINNLGFINQKNLEMLQSKQLDFEDKEMFLLNIIFNNEFKDSNDYYSTIYKTLCDIININIYLEENTDILDMIFNENFKKYNMEKLRLINKELKKLHEELVMNKNINLDLKNTDSKITLNTIFTEENFPKIEKKMFTQTINKGISNLKKIL
jgi:hypothetical protein